MLRLVQKEDLAHREDESWGSCQKRGPELHRFLRLVKRRATSHATWEFSHAVSLLEHLVSCGVHIFMRSMTFHAPCICYIAVCNLERCRSCAHLMIKTDACDGNGVLMRAPKRLK